jgi:asparaginyl-tRNA synthetase
MLQEQLSYKSEQQIILKIQTEALKAVHDYFYQHGFSQVMPIILSPLTDPLGPDPGSTVIKTGSIEYMDQKFLLTQSMILHKQIIIGRGVDRFYIMSPNVRLESAKRQHTGVHAFEFTQIDFELKEAKREDIFSFVEDLLRYIVSQVQIEAKDELKQLSREFPDWEEKFPVYSTHQLINKYGDDWEKLVSLEAKTPFWVVCHDREFYDKQDPKKTGHFLNYDLYYPEGFLEALSGAEREFEYTRLVRRIEEDEMDPKPYQPYLDLAKEKKLSPSAGGGLGVERLIRYLTGKSHIGEIQTFRRIPGEKVEY